jgi:hypothetical protein
LYIVFLIFSLFIQCSALYSSEDKADKSILFKTMWFIVKTLSPKDPQRKLTRKEFSDIVDNHLKIAVTISTGTILVLLIKLTKKALFKKFNPPKNQGPNKIKELNSVLPKGLSKGELYDFLYPINHISQQNIPHVNLLPDEVLLKFVALPMQQDQLEDQILYESSPNQPAPIKIGRPNSTISTESIDYASKDLEPSLTKPKIPDPYLSKEYTSPNNTSHTRSSSANSTSPQASSNNTGLKKIPKSLSTTSLSNQIPKKLSSSPENEKIKSRPNSILSTSDYNKKNKSSNNLNLKSPEFKSEKSQYPNYKKSEIKSSKIFFNNLNKNKSTPKINLSEAKNPIKNILSNDGLPEIPAQLKHKNLCRDPKCLQKATLHGNHFYSQRPLRLAKRAPIKIFYQKLAPPYLLTTHFNCQRLVPVKPIIYQPIIHFNRILLI